MTLLLLLLAACSETVDDQDGDGSPASEDCDDKNAAVYPGAEEVCDDLDNDCDGEGDPLITAYPDADADGFGDAAGVVSDCAVPETYVADGTDCDDTNAAIHPGADEADCTDPTDYNCDGSSAYADVDGDGSPACEDCDDGDNTRVPGATEVCDEVDNDCNDVVDDSPTDGTAFYTDGDGDGYGDALAEVACEAPAGTAAVDGDCDDGDATINPDALEPCDEVDNDCDGLTDDDDPDVTGTETYYADVDGDGYGDADSSVQACSPTDGASEVAGDCDDNDLTINPDRDETCDEIDNDCDGLVDDADDTTVGGSPWFTDADGDGYGSIDMVRACLQPAGTTGTPGDCDDADAAVNPSATEVCGGGDEDCDGTLNDGDTSTADKVTYYGDSDGDGHGSLATGRALCVAPEGSVLVGDDCDDTRASVSPDGLELCNGLDDNCDGLTDDADPTVTGKRPWMADLDGDTYGDATTTVQACTAPEGTVSLPGDCDDADPAINPAATEVCGGADEDCDGFTDDADSSVTGTTTVYRDADADGYGNAANSVTRCTTPTGFVVDATDCNDADATANPAGIEVCGTGDDDCDGLINDADPDVADQATWYPDADADTYGAAGPTRLACNAPTGFVSVSGDCDDADLATNPLADEVCGGGDDDCDGLIDDADPGVLESTKLTWYLDADHDGYGGTTTSLSCTATGGYIAIGGDCADGAPALNPGAGESCATRGVDDDCDTLVDAADADLYDGTMYYVDRDRDGVGVATDGAAYCMPPGPGYSTTIDDCDDTDDTISADCAEPSFTEAYDVVVVGTGPAGIAAALSAREMGASVLMLDLSPTAGKGVLAGRELLAVGTSHQAAAGITDSVEAAVTEWPDITGASGDTDAVRDYLGATADLLDWLESYGVPVLGVEESPDMGSVARSHTIEPEDAGSAVLVGEFDGDLRLGVEVTGPVMWGGEVVGVRWTDVTSGESGTTGAGAVIMATGGWQRNTTLRAERVPGLSARDWVYESIPTAGGKGLPFLDLLDAGMLNDDAAGIYVHATRDFVGSGEHEALTFDEPGAAIIVGEDGLRFGDEELVSSFSFYDLLPDGSVWLIAPATRADDLLLTRVFYNRGGGMYEYPLSSLPALSSDAWYADTLTELATLIGVDATALQGEVDTWNVDAAGLTEDSFGRMPADFGPIEGTGYYALRLYAGLARAFGGIATSELSEVLDADGVAIPGLYAAGEVAGMLPGGGSGAGFGGSVSACYYGGRVAGQEAATYATAP